MQKIIYITGGVRSGKSRFAQNLAEDLSINLRNEPSQSSKQLLHSAKENSKVVPINPIYLATAYCWDNDFEQRIKRHQLDRNESWRTIEEKIFISQLDLDNQVVLIDCITLWLTNIYYKNDYDLEKSLDFAKQEWNKFIEKPMTLIVVSNELGLGVHPESESARKFIDLQGWINQHIANTANDAYLLVSGIANKIK